MEGKKKKKRQIIHFLWITVLPPPFLIHLGKTKNTIIKNCLFIFADPLPPLSFWWQCWLEVQVYILLRLVNTLLSGVGLRFRHLFCCYDFEIDF